MKVVIIGNGLMANMTALYLSRKYTQLEIVLIGPVDRGSLPVVGESIIESTSHFLEEELGLRAYLQEHHIPKFGLTYYFKLRPDDPADRTYSVHCNERAPDDLRELEGWTTSPPSWLLNRDRLDPDIAEMTLARANVTYVDSKVDQVSHLDDGHMVRLENSDEIRCDWVIDCTGRRQLLARKHDLVNQAAVDKNCFWMRVDGIDRELIKGIDALGPEPPKVGESYHHDRYSTTHHFMGNGHWIWMIPLTNDQGEDRMSIGISWLDGAIDPIMNVEDLLAHTDQLHPVISEVIRSGQMTDQNIYRNFQYVCSQVYSEQRWALIGDAAFSPDPLFSNGIAFGCVQIEQVGELIGRDLEERLDNAYIKKLNDAFLMPVRSTQRAINSWYEQMDDPLISSLRLTWIEVSWFYMLLPMVHNKFHVKEEGLPLWKAVLDRPEQVTFDLPRELVEARDALREVRPEHFLYLGKRKVNKRALEDVESFKGVQEQVVEGGKLLQQYTKDVLERLR